MVGGAPDVGGNDWRIDDWHGMVYGGGNGVSTTGTVWCMVVAMTNVTNN